MSDMQHEPRPNAADDAQEFIDSLDGRVIDAEESNVSPTCIKVPSWEQLTPLDTRILEMELTLRRHGRVAGVDEALPIEEYERVSCELSQLLSRLAYCYIADAEKFDAHIEHREALLLMLVDQMSNAIAREDISNIRAALKSFVDQFILSATSPISVSQAFSNVANLRGNNEYRIKKNIWDAIGISEDRKCQLAKLTYKQYQETDEWRWLRGLALEQANHECKVCGFRKVPGSHNYLQMHHIHYPRRGEEGLSDVTILCRECHALYEGKPI